MGERPFLAVFSALEWIGEEGLAMLFISVSFVLSLVLVGGGISYLLVNLVLPRLVHSYSVLSCL